MKVICFDLDDTLTKEIDYLKSAFGWIKAHYRAINLVCGGFLVLVGVLMATGLMGRLISLLS